MRTKHIILWSVSGFLAVIIVFIIYMLPFYRFFTEKEILKMDDNLTVIRGGGGNSGLLVTDSAVVVIDTKMGGSAEELYKMAKEKAGQKKIIVINTHFHKDHSGGNHFYKYNGSKVYIGDYNKSALQNDFDEKNMPTDFVLDSMVMNLGNETVLLYDLGQAHTMHDVVVYLKNRKMLFSGDLVFNHVNPVLKKESGADVDKWVDKLNIILHRWDIKTLVPGHGKLGGKELAMDLKQYFEDMKSAASNPAQEKELKTKYAEWTKMPFMASPDKTIKYIKSNNPNE